MKRKLFCLLIILLCTVTFVSAQEVMGFDVEQSLTTDAAYHPLSTPVPADSGNHFAPVTGPYDGVEGRVTYGTALTIPVPFGEGPLVKGNTLVLRDTIELTPITIASGSAIEFTPIAFLVFTVGTDFGTGWNIGDGLIGTGVYNPSTHKYDTLGSFKALWWDFWAEGLFQFDLAAIIPGEWNHIVTQDSFKVTYAKMKGQPDGAPWMWQASKGKVNGWEYLATFIVGYQMPLVLNTVGIQTEISGRFNDDMYSQYAPYKCDIQLTSINPVAIFKFNEHHSLTMQLCFSQRRSYSSVLDSDTQSLLDLTVTGKEWFFNRIAFSWKYTL